MKEDIIVKDDTITLLQKELSDLRDQSFSKIGHKLQTKYSQLSLSQIEESEHEVSNNTTT